MVTKRSSGWIPNYHGAWAMIAIPPVLGAHLGGWTWAHLPLLVFWWLGYFVFFAGAQWLRSRLKPRFRTATFVYSGAAAIPGLWLAITHPWLMWWVPFFMPLITVTIWASWHRKDRSLANDIATIAAATLMVPVAASLSVDRWGWNLPVAGSSWTVPTVTALSFGYFCGTALYVKTNIRERGERPWLLASIAWHALWCALAWWLAIRGADARFWVMGTLWMIIVVRAIAVPMWGARHGWLSAKAIGVGEVVISVAFALIMLV